jgi:hypothetical protein
MEERAVAFARSLYPSRKQIPLGPPFTKGDVIFSEWNPGSKHAQVPPFEKGRLGGICAFLRSSRNFLQHSICRKQNLAIVETQYPQTLLPQVLTSPLIVR